MKPRINRERLASTFAALCELSSPSQQEGAIAAWLKDRLTALGASQLEEDDSARVTGSESGNLIARFAARGSDATGFFLCCHMDTVGPAEGVRVIRHGDLFKSGGETILGGDDKSGIAAILEMIEHLTDNDLPHPTIEVVITTCEEIGLLGAKALDYRRLRTPYGYALDSTGIDHVITGAPAANKMTIEVIGRAAHAGLCPEAGINALAIAATALSSLTLGRLDEESTCNFGLIEGGVAANIVPESVRLHGEVRSHSPEKLVSHSEQIVAIFRRIAENWPAADGLARIELDIADDYPVMALAEDAPVLARTRRAAKAVGRTLSYGIAGGGSDANILNGYGLPTAIIATGMDQVHTTEERLHLDDLTALCELLVGLAMVDG